MNRPGVVEVKISLMGKQNVGKSALVSRFKEDKFMTRETTIGAAYATVERKSKDGMATIKASIWDTAGMERFRSLVPLYIRDATAVFICFEPNYSLSTTIETIEEHIQFVRKENELCRIVLVQTKSDMTPTFDVVANREISIGLDKYSAQKGYKLYKTSSKTGTGVKNLFDENIEICYILKKAEFAIGDPPVMYESSDTGSPGGLNVDKATYVSPPLAYGAQGAAVTCCNIM